ncbi:hypothetical protein E4T39_07469 [Aureobasidium subglaciale]|nr:hypothetical protein E4T39_07469 [Aureobasidium subglaciale]
MHQSVNLWLFGVILLCLISSLLSVILRIVGRWRRQSVQMDDWVMILTGVSPPWSVQPSISLLTALQFLFTPCAVVALLSISQGLGTRDSQLDPDQIITASMYFSIFDLFYCITLGPLKCSLCLTLLRFARGRKMRQVIYIMIAFNIIAAVACFAGLLVMCRPYRTNWRYFYDFPEYPKQGSCFSGSVIMILVYILTAITSISDFVCVIIPAILFWNTQMDRQKKIMAWSLLSLGLLASIATLIRLPFTPYFNARKDRVWALGMATLCCCVEIALGIFAGCAPAIKPLFIAVISSIKSQLDSVRTGSSRPIRPTTIITDPDGLTDFSYKTADLKTIHSPRGDIVEITSTHGLSPWEEEPTPSFAFEISRHTV